VELYTELFYAIIPTLFLCFLLIWFDTFMMLFSTTGCVAHHESTRRWMV